jgi:RNA recognition motif-containing protein
MATINQNNPFPDTTCFICNIPFYMTESQILEFIPNREQICRASFPRSRTRNSRGYGFISYPNRALCQEAIAVLHQKEVRGRSLICRFPDCPGASEPIRERDHAIPPDFGSAESPDRRCPFPPYDRPPPPPFPLSPRGRFDFDPEFERPYRPEIPPFNGLSAAEFDRYFALSRAYERPDIVRRGSDLDLYRLPREDLIRIIESRRPPRQRPIDPVQTLIEMARNERPPLYFEDEE